MASFTEDFSSVDSLAQETAKLSVRPTAKAIKSLKPISQPTNDPPIDDPESCEVKQPQQPANAISRSSPVSALPPGEDSGSAAPSTDHILEVFDFPPSMRPFHIKQSLGSQVTTVEYVDASHALATFTTAQAARLALQNNTSFFKLRVYGQASKQAQRVDLASLPQAERPQTSTRTAHRLIAQALNLRAPRVAGSATEREAEKKREKEAREARRQGQGIRGQPTKTKTIDNSVWD